MAKKVILELNETQARTVLTAVEDYFRIRMGQNTMLANDLAFMNYQHDKNDPAAFDRRIQTRDAVGEVLRAALRIAFGTYGTPGEIPDYVHVAADIWSTLRYELSPKDGAWDRTPFQMGSEPLPKITVEEVE